jgi:hypothetical protein
MQIFHLYFETGGRGMRYAEQLFWRQAELRGKDKPKRPAELTASEEIR